MQNVALLAMNAPAFEEQGRYHAERLNTSQRLQLIAGSSD
jgi:hypothetical protein